MSKTGIEEKHTKGNPDEVKVTKMKFDHREKRLNFIFASLNNLYTFLGKILTSTNFLIGLIFYLLYSGKIAPQDAVKLFDNVITILAKDWTGHLLIVSFIVNILLGIAILLLMKYKVKPLGQRTATAESFVNPQRKSSELSADGFTNKKDK